MEINLAEIQRLSPDAISLWVPYPPAGSNCDFVIDGRDVQAGYMVWGSYDGNPNRDSFLAQELFNFRSPITGFALQVTRWDDIQYMPDPIIIGLCTTEMVSDPNKLYNPNEWLCAAALYADQLPDKNTWYWINANFTLNYNPDRIWLVAVTNQNWRYGHGGWCVGAYHDNPSPTNLNRWLMNEPGEPDGWQDASPFDMAAALYSQGGVPPVEGYAKIENPDFPGTAQEGTPYNYSFDLYNLNDPYCGCPETMCLVIIDRDTGQPIGDVWSQLLDCGYYFHITGEINFVGSGTFHGQIQAGHVEGSQCIIDNAHNFDVVVEPITWPCSHWANQSECEANNCYWWNGSCHDNTPNCNQVNNQADCTRYGCYWYNNSCHSEPEPGEAIGYILGASEFYEGPFAPGHPWVVAELYYGNSGTQEGYINARIYEYPGEANENQLGSRHKMIGVGAHEHWSLLLSTPTDTDAWPLGVKVWADTEPEPPWGSFGTKIF